VLFTLLRELKNDLTLLLPAPCTCLCAEGVSCPRICQTGLDTSRNPDSLNAWRTTFPYDYSSQGACVKSCTQDQSYRNAYRQQYGNSCNDICTRDRANSFGGATVDECQNCCAQYYITGQCHSPLPHC
jgi:hypothetical protein